MAWRIRLVVGLGLLAVSGCTPGQKRETASGGLQAAPSVGSAPAAAPQVAEKVTVPLPELSDSKPADYAGLHNVVAYAPGFYSGSAPDGPGGYDTLKALGIRTIISVDGAKPDVQAARARGMRYVHLPIGYNGMDHERTLELARATKELPGPIYIHCHHGKHRSAGAAGAVAVTLGYLDNDAAVGRMKVSGTAPNYTGLYKCVTIARLASAAELSSASRAFPETWKTSGLVQTMVEVDEVFEHLKAIEKARWASPADHPDLVPAAEAGRLADLLRTLKDDEQCLAKPVEFGGWLAASSRLASELEEDLLAGRVDGLGARFAQLGQSCRDCHAKYRD